MNYDYNNIDKDNQSPFPYGVNEVVTFSRSELAHVDISIHRVGDKKALVDRPRIYVRLNTGSYFYAWFEDREQAIEAMKAIYAETNGRIAIIKVHGGNKDHSEIRRDYITNVGSSLYYEAIRKLEV